MSFCFSHRAVKLFKARFSWNFPNTSIKIGSIERKARKRVLKAKTRHKHIEQWEDFNAACTFPLCFGMFINCMITSVNQQSNRKSWKQCFVCRRDTKREWNWKELLNINYLCANEDLFVVAVRKVCWLKDVWSIKWCDCVLRKSFQFFFKHESRTFRNFFCDSPGVQAPSQVNH